MGATPNAGDEKGTGFLPFTGVSKFTESIVMKYIQSNCLNVHENCGLNRIRYWAWLGKAVAADDLVSQKACLQGG